VKENPNHPFAKTNTAIIRTPELSCGKVFLNDSQKL
jgi:hypothetical protein